MNSKAFLTPEELAFIRTTLGEAPHRIAHPVLMLLAQAEQRGVTLGPHLASTPQVVAQVSQDAAA